MRIVTLNKKYPDRIFNEENTLPRFRSRTRVRVEGFQIAPLIQKAIENRGPFHRSLVIPGTQTIGLGQILYQRIERNIGGTTNELSVLNPYRVFIRYLGYKAEEIRRYSELRPTAPYGSSLFEEQYKARAQALPRLIIDRLLEISLPDQSAKRAESGFDTDILSALDQHGGYGPYEGEKFQLKADSDMDWGHLYVFEIAWDERGGIMNFEIPRSNAYSFITASFR